MGFRRLAVALIIAFLLSAAATYFFYVKMRQRAEERKLEVIKIVAAKVDLQAGTALTADNVTLAEWPKQAPLQGAFSKIEDIAGRSLIYPVSTNQPITDKQLAAPGSGIGLTVKIPEGMRAVSVRSNEIVGVAGFLYPGSRVDVLLTYRPRNSELPATRTILQNVEVLTAGQKIEPDPQGKPETHNVVTLLLTPEDSEKVVLASSQGSIQFVLRNGADSQQPATNAVYMDELLGAAAPTPEAKPKKVRVAPPKKNIQTVEVIAGEKRTVEKFEQ